jgi:hypothetical protein
VEKRIPLESSFPLFYPWDRKVEKNFFQGIHFSIFKYTFLPWTLFFSGTRKRKFGTWEILFS